MTERVKSWREQLNAPFSGQYPEVEGFYLHRVAHIINLGVESCMGEVRDKTKKNKIAVIGNKSKCEKKGFILQVTKEIRF